MNKLLCATFVAITLESSSIASQAITKRASIGRLIIQVPPTAPSHILQIHCGMVSRCRKSLLRHECRHRSGLPQP